MMFWLGVAVAYVLILAIGLSLGLFLSHRYPGDGRGPWDIPDQWNDDGNGGGGAVTTPAPIQLFDLTRI